MCVRPAGVLQGAWVVTDQLNPPQSACIIHAKHRACFLSPPPVLGPRMVWKRGLEQNLRSHYLPPPTLPPSVHSASQAPLGSSLGLSGSYSCHSASTPTLCLHCPCLCLPSLPPESSPSRAQPLLVSWSVPVSPPCPVCESGGLFLTYLLFFSPSLSSPLC